MWKHTDWQALEKELSEFNWRPLKNGTAEDAVVHLMDILWTLLIKHMSHNQIQYKRSNHLWLNSRDRSAIIQLNNSADKSNFQQIHAQCDLILREERTNYKEKLEAKLELPRRKE